MLLPLFAALAFGCASDPIAKYGPEGFLNDDTFRVVGVGRPPDDMAGAERRKTAAQNAALIDAKEKLARMLSAAATGKNAATDVRAAVLGAEVKRVAWEGDQTCIVVYELTMKGLRKKLR